MPKDRGEMRMIRRFYRILNPRVDYHKIKQLSQDMGLISPLDIDEQIQRQEKRKEEIANIIGGFITLGCFLLLAIMVIPWILFF